MFKGLKPILYGGREVWPLIEGGKGVSATNHASSGAWAAAGGIGTVSAVNADSYDAEGRIVPQVYEALTRRDRHEELIQYAIDGAVAGGLAGAVIGSAITDRDRIHRTRFGYRFRRDNGAAGAIIGGVLGAAVGSAAASGRCY